MKIILPEPSEHQIQQACINYLRAKGWMVLRLNSGKYSVGTGRFKRFIMGQEKGTPDLLCFKKVAATGRVKARLYFIEIKRPKGIVSLAQKMRMQELETYGARCLVVHSIEELQAML